MAFSSTEFLAHNVVGNRREDYIKSTSTDGSGTMTTRLSFIDNVVISQEQGTDVSATVINNTPAPGQFVLAAGASSGVYRFLVEGR